ncbi:hypothetical protein B0H34DRAFT_678025 [Crassisporium funariophilum]|nr:hypothetical protein B0H34DRAFT_678025 [Crassisporium funariophilum]
MNVFKVQERTAVVPLSPNLHNTTTIPMQKKTKFVLPKPTYIPPNPYKKTHARKQPEGHIPRPRNAFILFRCDFVRQKKIPETVENDHRNISRIVGRIWREMDEGEREPWVTMAEHEKVQHLQVYPGYRFSPGIQQTKKKTKRRDDIPHETQLDELSLWDDAYLLALYRSSSCPPGSLHVPQVNLESHTYGAPLRTRDDLGRRPSRITLYQTSTQRPELDPSQQSYFADLANQNYFSGGMKEQYIDAIARQTFSTGAEAVKTEAEECGVTFCGPRVGNNQYYVPGPNDAPEWENVSTEPLTWATWHDYQANASFARDINGDIPLETPPQFTNPFATSTLPPLPRFPDISNQCKDRCGTTPHALSPLQPLTTSADMSSFYSPLSGWKLPPLIHDIDLDTAVHRQKLSFSQLLTEFRKALDDQSEENCDSYPIVDLQGSTNQPFANVISLPCLLPCDTRHN